MALGPQASKAMEQGQALDLSFGKAQARIPDQLARGHPGSSGPSAGILQLGDHVIDQVAVGREPVHAAAVATAVHQHQRAAPAGSDGEEFGILAAAADIVDPVGTGFQGGCRHGGPEGVNREQHLGQGRTNPHQGRQ